ncbi:extracellular solute-binding protein [Amycolatopsis sp. NPDC047767]|uniref:ABC transporter substrate-binding protein n=1 Tax=Amycolatopsis sp. NPDC047767 TaxID=3156765 RepID=UPI0034535DC4
MTGTFTPEACHTLRRRPAGALLPRAVRSTVTRRGLALSAALLVGSTVLSGCGGFTPSGGSSTNGIGGVLRISSESGQPYLKDAADRFEKQHPGVTVQFVQSPSNTYQTTVRAQLAAGHGPDVMFVWGGSGNSMATKPLADAGLLEELTNQPWVSAMGAAATSLVSNQNKVYAFTSYQNPTGVEFNKDLLRQLGVAVPTKFSELLTFCRSVSSRGVVPIAIGNQTGYLNTEVPVELANSLVYSQDPQFARKLANGSVTWSGSALWRSSLTKALDEYVQMRDAQCFQPNSTGYSDTQASQLVTSGKALGVDVISPALDDLKQGNPKLSYDMFELPATENPADTYLTVNTGAAYAVAKSSGNKATAIEFLKYLAGPDQLDVAAKANYGVAYTPSASNPIQPEMQGVSDLYQGGKTALWPTNFWPSYETKQAMIAADQDLILGKKTVADVVQAVQNSLHGA